MVVRISARLISVLILAVLVASAVVILLHVTPEGLGLSDDSIAYIAGARSILAGNGYREAWLASNGPVTHFPPGYSGVLAFLGLFGLDPLRGARFIGAVLFGLNTALLGILGWRMTRSLVAGLALAALFVLGDSYLRLHAMALSEPLYIFLSLIAFWMFDLYCERDVHWLWLLACGSAVGLAYLTRYAALALIATFIVALVFVHASWRRRLIGIGIFVLGFLPWILGWAVRNAMIGGTATNRVLAWHPISMEKLTSGVHVASTFLMPVGGLRQWLSTIPGLSPAILLIVLGSTLAYVVWRFRTQRGFESASRLQVIPLINAVYVPVYLLSILASMWLFDASTKFRLRILAPAYVSLLILAVALGFWLWPRRRTLVLGSALAIFVVSTLGQTAAVSELRKGGQGYASFRWYDSESVAFLRNLPAEISIYTNEPGAVYLYSGKATLVLPDRVDPVTAAERPGFLDGVSALQAEVLAGKAVLAIFSGGDSPAQDVAALTNGLPLLHKSDGAEIFGIVGAEGP